MAQRLTTDQGLLPYRPRRCQGSARMRTDTHVRFTAPRCALAAPPARRCPIQRRAHWSPEGYLLTGEPCRVGAQRHTANRSRWRASSCALPRSRKARGRPGPISGPAVLEIGHPSLVDVDIGGGLRHPRSSPLALAQDGTPTGPLGRGEPGGVQSAERARRLARGGDVA